MELCRTYGAIECGGIMMIGLHPILSYITPSGFSCICEFDEILLECNGEFRALLIALGEFESAVMSTHDLTRETETDA